MRVLILGGYGFVGAQLMAELSARGHCVTGAGRDAAFARRRYPGWSWAAVDYSNPPNESEWEAILSGVDAVINCVGVLQDGGRDSTYAAHITGLEAVIAACRANRVKRFIQISAVGAEDDSPTEYGRSKSTGDAVLRASDLDWVVLKPSLIVGRTAYGGTALVRGLAGLPLITPVADADAVFRPVPIDDLVAATDAFLRPDAPSRLTLDVAGPEALTLRRLIGLYQDWLGFARTRLFQPPEFLTNLAFALGDALGRIGFRSSLRSTARRQMAYNVAGDAEEWAAVTSLAPTSLEAFFRAAPSTLADRWHARLYFLRPLTGLLFGLFWLLSGLIALWPNGQAARAMLADSGVAWPGTVWAATCALDILIGLWLLSGRAQRAALITALTVSILYLAALAGLTPSLFLDPAGAGLKTFLAPLTGLFLLATQAER